MEGAFQPQDTVFWTARLLWAMKFLKAKANGQPQYMYHMGAHLEDVLDLISRLKSGVH